MSLTKQEYQQVLGALEIAEIYLDPSEHEHPEKFAGEFQAVLDAQELIKAKIAEPDDIGPAAAATQLINQLNSRAVLALDKELDQLRADLAALRGFAQNVLKPDPNQYTVNAAIEFGLLEPRPNYRLQVQPTRLLTGEE